MRVPLLFGDKKTINARDIDINKPINSMIFEELVWWYKALMINKYVLPIFRYSLNYVMKHGIIMLDFNKLKEEVEKLLEQCPLKEHSPDKKIMTDYFLWFMRVATKEIIIPLSMYPDSDAIRRNIEDLIITADKEQRQDPARADTIKKRCLVEIMVILEDFYETEGRALFEKAYNERISDEEWPAYKDGVARVAYLNPRDVAIAPSLLREEQTIIFSPAKLDQSFGEKLAHNVLLTDL